MNRFLAQQVIPCASEVQLASDRNRRPYAETASIGTLAANLGLQAGDIITAINGQPINSQGDLARIYGQFESLGTVRAEIRRGGEPAGVDL